MTEQFSQAPQDLEAIYRRQVDVVYRVCYSFLGNTPDTQDAVQSAFVKLIRTTQAFTDEEHEKAWLIRVASNHCKDQLRSAARKNVTLDHISEPTVSEQDVDTTLGVVLQLDVKYRDVVYLYYYEGYSTEEIAAMLQRKPSTIRSHLSEARAQLKKELGGDWA